MVAMTMLGERIPQSLDTHPGPGSTVAGAVRVMAGRSSGSRRLPLTTRRHTAPDSYNV